MAKAYVLVPSKTTCNRHRGLTVQSFASIPLSMPQQVAQANPAGHNNRGRGREPSPCRHLLPANEMWSQVCWRMSWESIILALTQI